MVDSPLFSTSWVELCACSNITFFHTLKKTSNSDITLSSISVIHIIICWGENTLSFISRAVEQSIDLWRYVKGLELNFSNDLPTIICNNVVLTVYYWMDRLAKIKNIHNNIYRKKTIYNIDNWLYYKIMANRQCDYINSNNNLLCHLYVT